MKREIGLTGAVCVVVGNMIGVGIFTTVGLMLLRIRDPFWVIGAWLAGGGITLAAGYCYGALGATFPKAGGDYVFLREGLGSWAAFTLGWLLVWMIFPASIAALATACVEGIRRHPDLALCWREGSFLGGAGVLPEMGLILLLHLLSAARVRWTVRVQNTLTFFLLLVIGCFLVFGFLSGAGDWHRFRRPGSLPGLAAWGPVAIGIVFSYSGYFQIAYLGGEVRDPVRTVPLSILLSVALVTVIYSALVVLYLYAVPPGELAGRVHVGQIVAGKLWGEQGTRFVGLGIVLAVLGSLNATIPAGPRVSYAMSLDGCFPRLFSGLGRQSGAPLLGLVLQAALSLVYLFAGTFGEILSCASMAMVLSSLGAAIGTLRLRKSLVDIRAFPPARVTGAALVFLFSYTLIGLAIALEYPRQALLGLLVAVSALPVYLVWRRKRHGVS